MPRDFFEGMGQSDPYADQRGVLLKRTMKELDRPDTPAPEYPPMFTAEGAMEQASALGRTRAQSQVLQATGDEALMGLGKTMGREQSPEEFAMDAGKQEQVRRYQQWQADQAASKGRSKEMTDLLKVMEQDKPSKLPLGATRDINVGKKALRGISAARSTFKPDYQQVIHEYQGPLKNIPAWLTQMGYEGVIDKERAQEASLWWAQFNESVIAPLRHELFGATLTSNEQAAFDAIIAITPSSNPEFVVERLERMQRDHIERERDKASGYVDNWGNADAVRSLYGGELDYPDDLAENPEKATRKSVV